MRIPRVLLVLLTLVAMLFGAPMSAYAEQCASSYAYTKSTVDPWVKKWGPQAVALGQKNGFPPAAVLAQGGIESGWGKNPACGTNYYGIKSAGKWWKGDSCTETTSENVRGKKVTIKDSFAKPKKGEEMMLWVTFLKSNSNYKTSFNYPNDAHKFVSEVKKAGYATSACYLRSLNPAIDAIEESMKRQGIKAGDVSSSSDASKTGSSTGTDTDGSGGLTSEDDLTGMPDRNDYKSTNGLDVPGEKLEGMEGYKLAQLEDSKTLQKEDGNRKLMSGAIMLLGILILIYGIALGMAWMFDKANTVFDFSMLSVLTMGRLNIVQDKFDKGKQRVTAKKLIVIMIICFVTGGLVLTGGATGFVLKFYWWLTDILDKMTTR
jgi:hypothetical protein